MAPALNSEADLVAEFVRIQVGLPRDQHPHALVGHLREPSCVAIPARYSVLWRDRHFVAPAARLVPPVAPRQLLSGRRPIAAKLPRLQTALLA